MQSVSRRSFMKGAAMGTGVIAMAGLAGTALADELPADGAAPEAGAEGEELGSDIWVGEATSEGLEDYPIPEGATRISKTVFSMANWRVRPETPTEFTEELDCDVCVCGHGYAGINACRELSSQGYKVVLLEKKPEETYMAMGNASGCIGGTYIEERGYEPGDPIEFFNNWMLATGNVANQQLIMKWCQNCKENIDWYYGLCTTEELDTMADYYLDSQSVGNHRMRELGGLKFWNPAYSMYGSCSQTVIQGKQREDAIANGAEVRFDTEAYDTIQNEDGSIAAVIGQYWDGTFIKVNCKACILATGGFGSNEEMLYDLMLDMVGTLTEGESFSGMQDSDGRGIQMGYWAGGHLETWPIPGMNFKHYSPATNSQSTQPQALWLDNDCKRFCNEYFPIIEQRGRATLFKPRKEYYIVFDDNFDEYTTYYLPQHGAFDPTEANITSLRESMDKSYALMKGEVEEEEEESPFPGAPGGSTTYVCGDTIEELADNLGLEGERKQNFIDSVARYNEMCEQGVDEDFGRFPEVLFPVNKAPFYAATSTPSIGSTMCTLGGLLTDGEQNVVDSEYEPIPGLYATGNCCGRRYGDEYITPIFGISLGMVIVLGRECGKSVANWLASEEEAGNYTRIGTGA